MSQCSVVTAPHTGAKLVLTNNDQTSYTTSGSSKSGWCVVSRKGSDPCVSTVHVNCNNIQILRAASTSNDAFITPSPSFSESGTLSPILAPSSSDEIISAATISPTLISSGDANNISAPQNDTKSSSRHLAAIIGGSVGGATVLLIAILAFILVRRRRIQGRVRDRYMAKVHSEPDFDEKYTIPPSSAPNVAGLGDTSVLSYPEKAHSGQQHYFYQPRLSKQQLSQQQQLRSMTPSPIPPRNESRMSNKSDSVSSQTLPTRPGTPSSFSSHYNQRQGGAASPEPSKVDYTPKSTYIPSSSSTPTTTDMTSESTTVSQPKSRKAPPTPLQLQRQDSQAQTTASADAFIDLIPVEDTPKMTNAILQRDASVKQAAAYSQLQQHQANRSVSKGRVVGGIVNNENHSMALVDEDEEDINDEDIMYL
ncbi:hypothetical protein BGZ46_001847 [Entomortierella lignicola]|nr:hypothetical protein BGZ46_001847 [Entomortierella lignicola]